MILKSRLRTLLLPIAAVLAAGFALRATAQSSEPLLYQSNLVYQGAFRVPLIPCSPAYACFQYGGTALTYNSAHNSLYIVGHPYGSQSAEISIPAPVNSSSVSALNTATLLQPFADPLEGERNSINPTDPNSHYIGGQLVYGGKLIVSVYSYYDGGTSQRTSHFVRPLQLSTTGQVAGPFAVGSQYPGFVDGYMGSIPPEWQSLFGGPALTGNCCLAIAGSQSNGPAISVFNPAQLGQLAPTPAIPLVGYPSNDPLGGTGWSSQNDEYNGSTQITGVVFPVGTRSVLFFGRQGTGPFCYGPGTADQSLAGTPQIPGEDWCYDPANSSKGTHAYPYFYQVWAYDANDLLAVKNGTKQQYQIQPYAIWVFHMPIENPTDMHQLGGVAYDSTNGLLYVSQLCEDTGCRPIIDVFKIDGSITQPDPPSRIVVN